jgi:hypothetical protein
MSAGTDISALYLEFTDALTEVLAETAGQRRHVSDAIQTVKLMKTRALVMRGRGGFLYSELPGF